MSISKSILAILRITAGLRSKHVFVLSFVWALLVGITIQLVILPAIPGLHAGNGLLKGGDWVWFHDAAELLAQTIAANGWSAWELRPYNNSPIGLTAALYALTGVHTPLIALPFNALLFAFASYYLCRALETIDARSAFIASLPFVLFPSAATIYAQIHKDVLSLAGLMLLAWNCARLVKNRSFTLGEIASIAASIFAACFFVWLARPYLLYILSGASCLSWLCVVIGDRQQRQRSWWTASAIALGSLFLGTQLAKTAENDFSNSIRTQVVAAVTANPLPSTSSAVTATAPNGKKADHLPPLESALQSFWQVNGLLTDRLNSMREGYIDPSAGSNIDKDVRFLALSDVVAYIPRAMQIGLLAPFPDAWFARGASSGGTFMRAVSAIEMIMSYAMLFGLAAGLRVGKWHRVCVAAVFAVAFVPLIVHALVISNIGSLYRMRYGYWQLFNCLGLIGWAMWVRMRCAKDSLAGNHA